jgi:DNA-binding transcriptional LysR family regulator
MAFELRQLHTFLAVCRHLHFGRAAASLHISQPALSQQIRVLERDVGADLFVRTSHMVKLTDAGRALEDAAARVLLEADRAQRLVDGATGGEAGTLVIGSVNTALAGLTPRIMRAVRAEAPDLRLEVYHMDTAAQLAALADRRIDVGVVREAAPTAQLDNERLVSEPLVAVLPAGHRLAGREPLEVRALAGEPFVLWPRTLGPDFFDRVIAYCRAEGFAPRIVAEGDDVETQLALVASGAGVSLQPSYYAERGHSGLVFGRLAGEVPEVALQLAWRRADPSAAVTRFCAVARRVATRRGPDRAGRRKAQTS